MGRGGGGGGRGTTRGGASPYNVAIRDAGGTLDQALADLGVTDVNALIAATGALPGANVTVRAQDRGVIVRVYAGANSMLPDYDMDRRFFRAPSGELHIENLNFNVRDKGQGLGTKLFSRQVAAARRLGATQMITYAARGPQFNGYYTWPRLGYDASLTDSAMRYSLAGRKPPGGAKKVSDLMKTAEGRAWWRDNGVGSTLTFDLRSNSLSMRVHRAYLAERRGNG